MKKIQIIQVLSTCNHKISLFSQDSLTSEYSARIQSEKDVAKVKKSSESNPNNYFENEEYGIHKFFKVSWKLSCFRKLFQNYSDEFQKNIYKRHNLLFNVVFVLQRKTREELPKSLKNVSFPPYLFFLLFRRKAG